MTGGPACKSQKGALVRFRERGRPEGGGGSRFRRRPRVE